MIYPPAVTGQFQIERHGYPVNVQILKQANPSICSKTFIISPESLLPAPNAWIKE